MTTMASKPASRTRFFRRAGGVFAALALCATAYVGVRAYAARQSRGPRFETSAVDQGRISARVTATGTVSALVTVQVGSQVSGRITELGADFNSQVTKGQVIAKIDPQLLRAGRDQARANYEAAVGNLTKAKAQAGDAARQAERNKVLAASGLVSVADLDTSLANADAAKAEVEATNGALEQAQAALRSAEVNLDYTTIVSPIDGVVISRSVDIGQTVAASLQAPTLFTIAEDLKKMQVDTNVAEADVGRLEPGMDAAFTVDAYPSEVFHGRVRQIRNAPQTVQNVVTYDAVIDVENVALKLKPGMTANVTFVAADRPYTVRLANAALRFRPPTELLGRLAGAAKTASDGPNVAQMAGTRSVWALNGDRPERHEVRTGITDGTFTELVGGDVRPGELLITGLADATLPAGQKLPTAPPAPGGASRRMF